MAVVSPEMSISFGHGRLHAKGQLVVGDGRLRSRHSSRIVRDRRRVELPQQVQLAALQRAVGFESAECWPPALSPRRKIEP